jgi:hypothetical protein
VKIKLETHIAFSPFSALEAMDHLLSQHNVFLNPTLLNKSRLGWINYSSQQRSQPIHQYRGDDFITEVA